VMMVSRLIIVYILTAKIVKNIQIGV